MLEAVNLSTQRRSLTASRDCKAGNLETRISRQTDIPEEVIEERFLLSKNLGTDGEDKDLMRSPRPAFIYFYWIFKWLVSRNLSGRR
jgi:hypothetical protein